MPRYKHYSQLVALDILGGLCIIAAPFTGVLPGPGGIPLLIIGLSLLSINHSWAKKYIHQLREYADKVSDLIFVPKLRVFFDILAGVLAITGATLLIKHPAIWVASLGITCTVSGLVCFLGNRNRWARLKNFIKKH